MSENARMVATHPCCLWSSCEAVTVAVDKMFSIARCEFAKPRANGKSSARRRAWLERHTAQFLAGAVTADLDSAGLGGHRRARVEWGHHHGGPRCVAVPGTRGAARVGAGASGGLAGDELLSLRT